MVAVGRVRRAVGLDGRVEVELYANAIDQATNRDNTRLSTGTAFAVGSRTVTVERTRNGRKGLVGVNFVGVNDRNAAEALRGVELEVPESALPPLPEGAYYHYQLIGCAVADLSGRHIGTLSGIMETGSNDVHVLTSKDGRELLIPATKDTVKEIDIAKRLVTIDPPAEEVGPVAPE